MSTTFTRGENPLRADKLNTAFSERVSRSGDTMQGPLTLPADPTLPFQAATKQYVDRFTSVGVPSGAYVGPSPPGNALAPLWWNSTDGQLYVQYNDGSSTQWVIANSIAAPADGYLPLTGGTLTGALTQLNPTTGAPGVVAFPRTDSYQSPDSQQITGSVTLRGQPYGYYDTGTLLSLVAGPSPFSSYRAGVSGGLESGVPAIAGYATYDSVNIYSGNHPAPPPLVLHSVTYDATHIYPQTPLTAAQMKLLRVNMFVLTNSIDVSISATPATPNALTPERHYGSYVTGWAANGTSITVVGWTVPGSGHTAAGQVPPVGALDAGAPNATAYFGAMTNVFAANFVLQNNSATQPDSRTRTYQGIELDFQNWDATNYAMRVLGISMNYNAIGNAKLSSDSYGIKLSGFPTCLILQEIAGYTQVLLKSDAFDILNVDSPTTWAGSATTNLTWESSNFIDTNRLRLLCWTSRDSATVGWTGASVHLGMRVDGTPLTMTGGSPMAQVVWNAQGFTGGLQLQNQAGVAGLTVDNNGWVFPRVVNAANDAAAASASVPVGAMYRNGSVLMVRTV